MKVGDMVRVRSHNVRNSLAGVIIDVVHKKCWRASGLGRRVDWDMVEPEPHGVIMVGDRLLSIPLLDLEIIPKKE